MSYLNTHFCTSVNHFTLGSGNTIPPHLRRRKCPILSSMYGLIITSFHYNHMIYMFFFIILKRLKLNLFVDLSAYLSTYSSICYSSNCYSSIRYSSTCYSSIYYSSIYYSSIYLSPIYRSIYLSIYLSTCCLGSP